MPRPSPQTDRVVAVIEVLTEAPQGATMTQLASALGISQSTAVHLLGALTNAGFVTREASDRTYHLGPALVRPGQVAAARHPILAAARAEMTAVSRATRLPSFAFAPEGDHARMVQFVWPPGDRPPPVRLGDTLPLTPPLGMVFLAWAPEPDFAAWLALDRTMAPEHRARLHAQRGEVRRLGFVAELAPPEVELAGLASVLDDRDSPYRDGLLLRLLAAHGGDDHVVTDLGDATRARQVTSIGAPVFGADGTVVLSMSLAAFPAPLTSAEMRALGGDLRLAADRATKAIGGHRPQRR